MADRWRDDPATPRRRQPQKTKLPPHAIEQQGSTSAFLMEVDGVTVGRFTEVTGLQVQVEMETFNEGGMNGYVRHLPGRMTWPNLVLKRGLTKDNNLLAWLQKSGMHQGGDKVAPTTAAITLINGKGERMRTWNLIDAVPVRWSGPTMANSDDDRLEEELEIAHHGFDVETFG